MKSFALILILLTYHAILFAQAGNPPFRPGAMWWYNYSYGTAGGFQQLIYEKDTVVDGFEAAAIVTRQHEVSYDDQGNFTHKDSILPRRYFYADSIGLYEFIPGTRGFVYPNGADLGTTFTVSSLDTCCGCATSDLVVTATGQDNFDGLLYPWYEVSAPSNSVIDVNAARIYTTIGPMEFPFIYPQKNCMGAPTDNGVFNLVCYQDNTVFLKFTQDECDAPRYLNINNAEAKTDLIRVFPNPADAYIFVSSVLPIDEVYMFDLSGREVYKADLNLDNTMVIPSSNFTEGTYTLQLVTGGGVETRQVVIQ